jgi:hypothetical protein
MGGAALPGRSGLDSDDWRKVHPVEIRGGDRDSVINAVKLVGCELYCAHLDVPLQSIGFDLDSLINSWQFIQL